MKLLAKMTLVMMRQAWIAAAMAAMTGLLRTMRPRTSPEPCLRALSPWPSETQSALRPQRLRLSKWVDILYHARFEESPKSNATCELLLEL